MSELMMTKRLTILVLAAGVSALGVTKVSASPIDAGMFLKPSVQLGGVMFTDQDSDRWADYAYVPVDLHVYSGLSVFDVDGVITRGVDEDICMIARTPCAGVQAEGAGHWSADGNSGSVDLTGYQWTLHNGLDSVSLTMNDHSGGDDWTYQFSADADGTFSMDYLVTGILDTFGLQGWAINWSGPGGGTGILGPGSSGTFVRPIIAGNIYTVSLSNNSNIWASGGYSVESFTDTPTGRMDGHFNFRISNLGTTVDTLPTPEPASLLLFGSGLTLVARRLRRARN
jgi:PEP-CTERM motif